MSAARRSGVIFQESHSPRKDSMTGQSHSHKDQDEPIVYPEDVHILQLDDKKIILVATAHISRDSIELVRLVIAGESPEGVCVELDEKRFRALSHKFAALDIKEIIRKKQLSTLLINLMLSSYQKKLGSQLGVLPGTEMLAAAQLAEERHIPVHLADRDVRVTLRRAWHATSFIKKSYLLASIFASLFDKTEITEEKLAELKNKDVLSELLNELGAMMPELKKVIIDERDIYLAEKIKQTPGKKIVAVVGAGHVEGIKQAIATDNSSRMAEISRFPPVAGYWKALGWAVPAVIIASLVSIGIQKGGAAAGANLMYWILANGIPSALGAMLALAHPLTIIGAFTAAPVTSLTPVIGAGYVTAFIQVIVRPPVVQEFETVLEDMATVSGWWRNKLLKVFLAFLLPGLGSMIGTYLGGYKIISNLF